MDLNCLLCDQSTTLCAYPSETIKSTLCKALRLPEKIFVKKMERIKFCQNCSTNIEHMIPIVTALASLETTVESFVKTISKKLRDCKKRSLPKPRSKNIAKRFGPEHLVSLRNVLFAGVSQPFAKVFLRPEERPMCIGYRPTVNASQENTTYNILDEADFNLNSPSPSEQIATPGSTVENTSNDINIDDHIVEIKQEVDIFESGEPFPVLCSVDSVVNSRTQTTGRREPSLRIKARTKNVAASPSSSPSGNKRKKSSVVIDISPEQPKQAKRSTRSSVVQTAVVDISGDIVFDEENRNAIDVEDDFEPGNEDHDSDWSIHDDKPSPKRRRLSKETLANLPKNIADGSGPKYVCEICQWSSDNSKSWFDHSRYFHGEKNQICDLCGKAFAKRSALVVHQKVHGINTKSSKAKVRKNTNPNRRYTAFSSERSKVHKHVKPKNIADPNGSDPQYVCEFCPSWSSNKEKSWYEHITYFHGEWKYKCETCGLKFSKRSNYKNHLTTHEEKKCPECDQTFSNTRLFLVHTRLNHKDLHGKFMCKRCNLQYFTEETLEKHRNLKHNGENVDFYECHICSEPYNDIPSLNTHKNSHIDPERPETTMYHCTHCPKSFKQNSELEKHVKRHEQTETYTCNICNKVYLYAHSLKEHELTHDPDYKKNQCPFCQEILPSQKQLVQHKKSCKAEKTAEPTGHSCSHCQEIFPTKTNLILHLNKVHQDDSLGTLTCTICNKTYHRLSQYRLHMSQYHTKNHNVFCEECGKGFYLQSLLNKHKIVHSSINFICPSCGKCFKGRQPYQIHMRQHAGETPFKCESCDKAFVKEYQLRVHAESHSLERNHVCEICAKSFKGPASLVKHLHMAHERNQSGKTPQKRKSSGQTGPKKTGASKSKGKAKKGGRGSSKSPVKTEQVTEEIVEETFDVSCVNNTELELGGMVYVGNVRQDGTLELNLSEKPSDVDLLRQATDIISKY